MKGNVMGRMTATAGRRTRHPAVLAAALLLGGSLVNNAGAVAFECVTPVHSLSDRARMSAGDFSANGYWREIALSPHSLGYGPAAQREYELTIAEGQVTMARPEGTGVEVRHQPRPDEGFAMLQVASPASWVQAAELAHVGTFDDLNFELDMLVEENGCGDDVLLPFKIIGRARSVTWSLDTQPEHRIGESLDEDVVIVGIYNRNDKERYFMVPGYNLHAHVVISSQDLAGHLRNLELEPGAKLWLPGRAEE